MDVFGKYAEHYDTFYRTKDYARECDYLEQVFATHGQQPVRSVLDLGCGTGGHSLILARRGYQVTGVDRSPTMLSAARTKLESSGAGLSLLEGDVRDIALDRTFDAIVSMFAVVGYVTTAADLDLLFRNARRHLVPGGLFTFDVWYGPAVLADRPRDRWSLIEQAPGERILRLVRSQLDDATQVVTVEYRILVLKDRELVDECREAHRVRYFFVPELELMLASAGFEVAEVCTFLEPGKPPRTDDWNLSVVARATR